MFILIFFKFIQGLSINLSRIQSYPSSFFTGKTSSFPSKIRVNITETRVHVSYARSPVTRKSQGCEYAIPPTTRPSTRNWNRIGRAAMSHWLPLIILIEQTRTGKQINGIREEDKRGSEEGREDGYIPVTRYPRTDFMATCKLL